MMPIFVLVVKSLALSLIVSLNKEAAMGAPSRTLQRR
jgi:hypothetical protein